MEVAITKISQNGQIVIPSEIRRDAGIKPSTKFIVFNQDGNIFLKQLRKENLMNDMRLIEQVQIAEEGIKKGKYVKANTKMRDKEIDELLMA
jgi:AbrB family looped-hinge helix DNA binding protein